jgi:hypothetical protein
VWSRGARTHQQEKSVEHHELPARAAQTSADADEPVEPSDERRRSPFPYADHFEDWVAEETSGRPPPGALLGRSGLRGLLRYFNRGLSRPLTRRGD